MLGLLVSTSAAQVELGLIGGTTLSNLDASSPDSVGSKLSRKADITVGGIIEFGLSRSLSLVLEPMYSRRSIGSERSYFELPVPSELSFAYIDLPVLLKFSLDFPLIKPYLLGGGTASFLLEAEETYLNDLVRELYGETVDIKEDASEADFSWTVGGGVSVPFGLLSIFAEGRYSQGTIDIFDSDDREVFHEGFRILDMLPDLTCGRRIRKLTHWFCSMSNLLHPGALGCFLSYFGEFCELMAPRPCPCGCKQDLCRTACENPDGRHPPGYSCPGEDDPGTIYMAAWHQQEYRGEMRYLASKLYINPGDAATPLASPNGNVRAITVTSPEDGKWEARTSIEHGARGFDGITVGMQSGFEDDHKDRSYLISDLDDRQKPDSGDIPNPPDYEGPRSCAGGEGCIPAGGAV